MLLVDGLWDSDVGESAMSCALATAVLRESEGSCANVLPPMVVGTSSLTTGAFATDLTLLTLGW